MGGRAAGPARPARGRAAGAEKLGATVYEVDPGGRVSPLHVHHANEEMLIVLSGTADAAPGGRRARARARRARGVPGRTTGRAPGAQPLRRGSTSADRLNDGLPGGGRTPRQREGAGDLGRPDETAAMFLAFRKGDAVPVTEGEEGPKLRLGRAARTRSWSIRPSMRCKVTKSRTRRRPRRPQCRS